MMHCVSRAALLCLLPAVAMAQPGQPAQPALPADQARPEPAKVAPAAPMVPPTPTTTDAEIKSVLGMLVGSFACAEAEGQPSMTLHTSYINAPALDNAVYFELARTDSPAHPFRQGILHLYRRQGALTLRQFDFARSMPGQMLAGLWAVPEALPTIKPDQAAPICDITLKKEGDGYKGASTHPIPTMISGATEFTGSIAIAAGGLNFGDRGFDASGKQVWGPGEGKSVAFVRVSATPRIERRDGGLIVIDIVPGKSGEPAAQAGSDLAMHYTGWTTDGTQFDTSRREGREPLRMTLPGNLIPGWNQGVPGIAVGCVRKLVIPGPLGYGERGNSRARIGPNATLIFEIECVFHKPGAAPEKMKEDTVGGEVKKQ